MGSGALRRYRARCGGDAMIPTDTDGLLKDAGGPRINWTCGCGRVNAGWATHCGSCNWTAGGARPRDDLDGLIERLNRARESLSAHGVTIKEWDGSLYLEAAAALVQLREENARLASIWDSTIAANWLRRAERAETEVARLKDALRQANGVRDVFASAVVAQAMQDIDPAKVKPCDCVRPEIHGHQLLCKHGKAR